MNKLSLSPILITIISVTILASCHSCGSGHATIQEFPTDSIYVYAPLEPNESWMTGFHTYGRDSIIGHSIECRLASDSAEVYVNYKITILELHPRITANLLSFAHEEMRARGFVNEGDTIPPFDIYNLSVKGVRQDELVRKLLDWEARNFYGVLPEILDYDCGFNMEIELYPVFLNDNYVTYQKYAYYYTGGAHGNYTIFLQTYNLSTGETVNMEDFIEPSKLDKVRERVVMHMARNYAIYSSVNTLEAYLDSLNRWKGVTNPATIFGHKDGSDKNYITVKNYPLNDPGLHEAGLVFTYDKYHLTPGCDGCPTVLIPFDEIRDCLKEPFYNYHTNPSKVKGCNPNEEYYYIGNEQIDSIRAAWSPTDDGGNWPRDISDWYKYRHGDFKSQYSINKIIGTWYGYGHLYDSRNALTITPDGHFTYTIEEAAIPDKNERMQYDQFSRSTQGSYEYDQKWNKLTLRNYDRMRLDKETLEAFVKIRHPEHKYLIIHSIVVDTMYVADEDGDLWPFIRCRGKEK